MLAKTMPRKLKKNAATKLADLMKLNRAFRKSVQLDHDFLDKKSTEGFVATDFIEDCFGRIQEAFQSNSTQRAWRLTGDYGSGKSAFALNILKVACGRQKEVPSQLKLRKKLNYTPVIVIGDREPILTSIGKALVAQVPSLSKARLPVSNDELINLLKKAIDASDGIFLVFDEMGKHLEYAMMHPDSSDVYILQKLAEMADRSGSKPFVFMAILHLGITSYFADVDSTSRKEWEKVSGRFNEITYQHPFEQTVQLCVNALNLDVSKLPANLSNQASKAMRWCVDSGMFGHASSQYLSQLAPSIFPLHPTVLAPLNAVLKRFGQNERSLFSFLTGNEPHTLQEIASVAVEDAYFYRISNLYDYIKSGIAPAMTNGRAAHWRVIESVVRQSDSNLEALILKTAGVLNLLDADNMLATAEMLQRSLAGEPNVTPKKIESSIRKLKSRHLLFERGIMRGYALWPHTSVHLDDEFEKALEEQGEPSEPMRMVASLLEPRQIVARRHYIETGNLRHFELQFLPANDFIKYLEKGPTAQLGDADGFLTVFLPKSQREYKETVRFAVEPGNCLDSNVSIAVSRPPLDLLGIAKDVQAWRHVSKSVTALASDEYARKELQRQLRTAEERLDEMVSKFVGSDLNTTNLQWFQGGVKLKNSGEAISKRLSSICDQIYPDCPYILNELVNRRISSSAGSRARTALIEHMSKRQADPFLGMDESKNPPEMSIYLSILQAGNIHVEDTDNPGMWKIAFPKSKRTDNCRLKPSLKAIEKFLKANEGQRVSLDKVIDLLTSAPIGARQGVVPLILAIYIAATPHATAVYEDATYIHSVGADKIQRMAKEPEYFELQHCAVEGVKIEVFRSIAAIFGIQETQNPAVLDVVRPLMQFISTVPEYARNTKKLQAESIELRQALLTARDPSALVFKKIPQVIGVDETDGGKIGEKLSELISDIQNSYDRLLARLAQSITDAFDTSSPIEEFREELGLRAKALAENLTENDLRSFVLRLGDKKLNFKHWLESLANHLARKSSARWNDQDEDIFDQKLGSLAKRMLRAEAANDDITRKGLSSNKKRVVRLALTKPDGSEHAELLHWSEDEEEKVNELEKQILELINKNGRAGLGATAKALWAHLEK